MHERIWMRSLNSRSDNRESKTCTELSRSIENPKWLALSALVFAFLALAAVVQAQQRARGFTGLVILAVKAGYRRTRGGRYDKGLRELGYIEGTELGHRMALCQRRCRSSSRTGQLELVGLKARRTGNWGNADPPAPLRIRPTTIPIVVASAGDMVGRGLVYKSGSSRWQHHGIDKHRPGNSMASG